MRHTLQTAGKLPAELSASVPVGVIRLAMMGDQSWGKWWRVARSVGVAKVLRFIFRCSLLSDSQGTPSVERDRANARGTSLLRWGAQI